MTVTVADRPVAILVAAEGMPELTVTPLLLALPVNWAPAAFGLVAWPLL